MEIARHVSNARIRFIASVSRAKGKKVDKRDENVEMKGRHIEWRDRRLDAGRWKDLICYFPG